MTMRWVLYKRWKPRPGATTEEILRFVREQAIPSYASLSGEVELGLELLSDGRAVLAIQRWSSREAYVAATKGPHFDAWWEDYLASLGDWYRLLEFEREWETTELI